MADKKFPGLRAEVGADGKICVLMVGGDSQRSVPHSLTRQRN